MNKSIYSIALSFLLVPCAVYGMKSSESVVVDVEGMEDLEASTDGSVGSPYDPAWVRENLGLGSGVSDEYIKNLVESVQKNNSSLIERVKKSVEATRGKKRFQQTALKDFASALIQEQARANQLMEEKMKADDRELQQAKQVGKYRYYLSFGVSILFSLAGSATGIAGLVMAAQKPDTSLAHCLKTCLEDPSSLVESCVRSCLAD